MLRILLCLIAESLCLFRFGVDGFDLCPHDLPGASDGVMGKWLVAQRTRKPRHVYRRWEVLWPGHQQLSIEPHEKKAAIKHGVSKFLLQGLRHLFKYEKFLLTSAQHAMGRKKLLQTLCFLANHPIYRMHYNMP